MVLGVLILMPGAYGAFSVFHFAEDWVTARSFAEMTIVASLALYFWGHRASGLLLAMAALLIHPLMALPGVLLIACMCVPLWMSLTAAIAGVATVVGISVWSVQEPGVSGLLAVMDPTWLQTVRERSQFLFLDLWRVKDWAQNLMALPSLALTALLLPRLRRWAWAAMAVGTLGFAVASVATLIGPLAILIQGQAWRWSWISSYSAITLIVPTALAIARDQTLRWPLALLFIAAWTFAPLWGCICLTALLLLSLPRRRYTPARASALRLAAVLTTGSLCLWNVKLQWGSLMASGPMFADSQSAWRQLFSVQLLALLVSAAFLHWICRQRSVRRLAILQFCLLIGLTRLIPFSMTELNRDGTPHAREVFAEWREIIAPDQAVFVAPAHNSPSFAWFTLERPSYLTVDQSSGVVFSRAAAIEVRRRSEVLRPIMSPDWQLLSNFAKPASAAGARKGVALTRDSLALICRDPILDFVIAQGDIGIEPLRRANQEPWRGWNLYRCRVRPADAHGSDTA